MNTTTVHPALAAVRETPEYAALAAEWRTHADNISGGDVARQRKEAVGRAVSRLEHDAVALWDTARLPADPEDGVQRLAVCDRCGDLTYLTGNIWPHANGLLFCDKRTTPANA